VSYLVSGGGGGGGRGARAPSTVAIVLSGADDRRLGTVLHGAEVKNQ
jgi:hypothetical protein